MNPNAAAHEKYQFKPFKGSSHFWALEILSNEPPVSAVLDIGAGGGAIGKELKERKFENLHAIEVDEKSKEHISQIYNSISDDLQSITFKNFDIILLLDVLEHVPNPKSFYKDALAL